METLKQEKLKIDRWRESTQITAQVKTVIFDCLQWLPQESYDDDEVNLKSELVFQHIFSYKPEFIYPAARVH